MDNNHFYSNEFVAKNFIILNYKKVRIAFEKARYTFRIDNRNIINLTDGGELHVFLIEINLVMF